MAVNISLIPLNTFSYNINISVIVLKQKILILLIQEIILDRITWYTHLKKTK